MRNFNFIRSIITFSLILYFLLTLTAPSPVFAQAPPSQIGDIVGIIRRFIEVLAPAAAIAFFIMVIMAAFRFINFRGLKALGIVF